MNDKGLLVVGAGIEAIPGIQLARDMGLHVVASDINPNAPGLAIAHDCIIADTFDTETTVREALKYDRQRHKLHGVICIATDVPFTVASVAHALGLPGISLESARLAMDKLAMKDKFSADGIPVPWYAPVASVEDLASLVDRHGYPLVLKPVDSRGARGVLLLRNNVPLDWAYHHSRSYSPTGRVMVERYLHGPQVSTESLVVDGVVYTPGFADRNYEYLDRYAPHMIENGGELPSALPAVVQEQVRALVARAAVSMGIRNGVVKGDIVVCDGQPHVIELAARLSGGYFCTHEIPLVTGVEFVKQAIRLAVGEKVLADDLTPRRIRPLAQRYLFPDPGVVQEIQVADWIRRDPDIVMCEIRVKVGDAVKPIDSHPSRAGVVMAIGADRASALDKAIHAVSGVRIVTTSTASGIDRAGALRH